MTNTLQGLRILNTRPKDQAAELSSKIRAAGGMVIESPALEIIPTDDSWHQRLTALPTVDSAIFISKNAVLFAFNTLKKHQIHWPDTITTIPIGKGTAKTLETLGITVADIPASQDSESLIQLSCFQRVPQNILLFKGMGGRDVIERQLSDRGHRMTSIAVYRRRIPSFRPDFIKSIWQENQVDIILLTSAQSLLNLFVMFGSEGKAWLQTKTWLTISPRLAKTAQDAGIKNIIVASPDTIIESLESLGTKGFFK